MLVFCEQYHPFIHKGPGTTGEFKEILSHDTFCPRPIASTWRATARPISAQQPWSGQPPSVVALKATLDCCGRPETIESESVVATAINLLESIPDHSGSQLITPIPNPHLYQATGGSWASSTMQLEELQQLSLRGGMRAVCRRCRLTGGLVLR